MSRRFAFPLLAALVLVPAGDRTARAEEAVDEWRVIEMGGKRIGWEHLSRRTIERGGETLVATDDRTHITLQRFGQKLVMEIDVSTLETEAGELLELRTVTRNPPAASSKSVAVVKGDELEVTHETNGRRTKSTLPWKSGTKSPAWDPLDAETPLAPGDERTHETFVPEFDKFATITTRAVGHERVTLPDGTERRLLKVVSTNSAVPGETKSYVDDDGREVLVKVDLLGTEMVLHTVPREVALEKIVAAELDLAVETEIPVARIPNAHRTKRIVYRVHADGDDPARLFSDGGTQEVERVDEGTIELTVTAATFEEGSERAPGEEYLRSTRFLQTDDERVAEHAAKAAGDATDSAAVAKALEGYVRREIREKNFSTAMASAAEVAERMEGDCTEHAVLLAAMLRARDVPSRIAVGYVYVESRSAFVGHMWTEAFLDGRWVPLDGTLGRGGTAAAHLKLADASFGDDGHPLAALLPALQAIGRLRVEVVEVE